MNKSLYIGVALLGCSALLFVYTRQPKVNPRSTNEQMIATLQKYIQIDTSHPTPQYDTARAFLKQMARKDGFLFKEISLPSGNSVAVISYQGTDTSLPSLILNHHMDVVPVPNPSEWIAPPFAGEIKNGCMIGRGTQDMKGIGIVHYYALQKMKNAGIQPKRTIHIVAVPDEEVGGFKGTKEFVATQAFKDMNVGFIIDEGHASGVEKQYDLKVSERKPIQIRITSRGALSHGSRLCCENANYELVHFLEQMRMRHKQEQAKAETEDPGKLLSLNITSLLSGARTQDGFVALNVVPEKAEATIDVRVPPTMKCADVIAFLDEAIRPFHTISYEIIHQAEEEPELPHEHTPLYRALEKTITESGLTVKPHYFEATTDLRFYLDRGIDGIGLSPFCVIDNIHGTNEAVPLHELIQAKKIMYRFLIEFCS